MHKIKYVYYIELMYAEWWKQCATIPLETV